jgi:hypothetical protein
MPSSDSAASAARPSFPGLILGIALFVVIGIPLTAYVWETLNQLLAGREIARGRVLLTMPALALLIGVWRVLARTVQQWDAQRHPDSTEGRLP